MNQNPSNDFVTQLCLKCGLCCDGVLFADVRLQKSDDARRLTGLGLPLKKRARQPAFPQPCGCFDGTLCRIYAGRPQHCRAFACGLLKRVQAVSLEADVALRKIAEARKLADTVRQLLRRLGDKDEQQALTRRYVRVMRQPIDLSAPEEIVNGRGRRIDAGRQ
jgi:uncharacterized protein